MFIILWPILWILTWIAIIPVGVCWELKYFIGWRVRLSRLAPVIEKTMRRLHRSHIRLRARQFRCFVDFYKLELPRGQTRLILVVPRQYCNEDQFRAASETLAQLGMDVNRASVAPEGIVPLGVLDSFINFRRFRMLSVLAVDCGTDVVKAETAARAVLVEAFGVSPEGSVRVSTFRTPAIWPDKYRGERWKEPSKAHLLSAAELLHAVDNVAFRRLLEAGTVRRQESRERYEREERESREWQERDERKWREWWEGHEKRREDDRRSVLQLVESTGDTGVMTADIPKPLRPLLVHLAEEGLLIRRILPGGKSLWVRTRKKE